MTGYLIRKKVNCPRRLENGMIGHGVHVSPHHWAML